MLSSHNLTITHRGGDLLTNLNYILVDVFTDKQFGGNQLAVFTDERELSSQVMQSIAKELNLSETVFVLQGSKPGSKRLRIFTPGRELPMAGHPTIGTAYILASEGFININEGKNKYIFEENAGDIEVTIFKEKDAIVRTEMSQPLPQFKERYTDKEAVAKLLSLSLEDLHDQYPIQTVSAGIPFLYIPVQSLNAMKRINFRQDIWEHAFSSSEDTSHIFVFTMNTEHEKSHVHSRMFAPAMGISEDPATGSASGPLGAYLVYHEIIQGKSPFHIVSEQGIEINRPSFVDIRVIAEGKTIHAVSIGGSTVKVGRGELNLNL